MMQIVRRSALFGAMLGIAVGTVRAQAAVPTASASDPRMGIVDSLAIIGDTAAALDMLSSMLADDERNAAAWHRRGELALLLSRPRGSDFKWNDATIRYMRIADSSLARAIYLAPDSARYQLTRAAYYLAGELPMVREGAHHAYRSGLDAARRTMDSAMVAELAIQLGLWYWKTYEGLSHRHEGQLGASLYELMSRLENIRDQDHVVRTYFHAVPNSGETDHLRATDLFLLALRFEPENARAWRYAYLSLIALESWEELESATRIRLRSLPHDAWTRLAAGLALHRSGRYHEATESFRLGLRALTDQERRRLTRLTRLLRPSDSTRLAGLPQEESDRTEQVFWFSADPLMLTAEHEHLLEFLSRVTYSELMFSVEEFNLRGADTPRGEVYIRYGPPSTTVSEGPDEQGYYSIYWRYSDGLWFLFRLFGQTRRVQEHSFAEQRAVYDKYPYRFDNLPISANLDTISVAVTRFRGTQDSTDALIAAQIPVGRLSRELDLARGSFRVGLFTFGGSATRSDTSSIGVPLIGDSSATQLRTWSTRFGSSNVGFRVEAYQVESGKGARTRGAMLHTPASGFGMSDILLADDLEPTVESPERWLDLTFQANVGTLDVGEDLALAWETYDLAADSTRSSAYSVEISLVRTDGSRLGRAIARVIGGTLGRGEGRGRNDRVAVSFDRRVPARPVTLDYLTLDLGDLDPGRYRLTITVTDAVRNVSTESTRELEIER